jgi:S1-C subfamily serine protease
VENVEPKVLKRTLLHLLSISIVSFGGVPSDIGSAIVKVYTVVKTPDYITPWSSSVGRVTGSGFLISGERILTNAHVVANSTYIEVQKYGERRRYGAYVEAVSHQLDLALLKVKRREFYRGMHPLQPGGLPRRGDKVSVYGFPIGGDTMSVTTGIVSRMEHQLYVHSGEHFLSIQIDAAVYPGNSGGPAISIGKFVGVVMQSIGKGQNISYLIPTVLVKHFLTDISDGKLDGSPSPGIVTQNLENPSIKRLYGVREDIGGIVVERIIAGSSLDEILKKGDIVLSIDGHDIENDASAPIGDREYTDYEYYAEIKQLGESVSLKILREGREIAVDMPLLTTADDLLLVKTLHYDKMPRYLIYGGFLFTPLTRELTRKAGGGCPDAGYFSRRLVDRERKEMVILLRVLPDATNRGYHDYGCEVIDSVDGAKVKDFEDFGKKILEGKNEYAVITNIDGIEIVIDRKSAGKVDREILEKYNIGSWASPDIEKRLNRERAHLIEH